MNAYRGKTIFVQIAAYRDKELLPTLRDMLDKADEPDALRVCIAWQHHADDEWDNLDDYINDSRFTIIDLDSTKSKGACWARNLIQQEYDKEYFTLQLDSHHRFKIGWDTVLKNTLYSLKLQGVKKPLLTGYIPSYDPETGEVVHEPWRLCYQRFAPEGPLHTVPEVIPNWKDHTGPVRARFYSAHFCFTLGRFTREVQHDPELYFHGEEITIGVRAFTHGYDLYHLQEPLIWHYYHRNGSSKHWGDHEEWGRLNKKSYSRVRKLLGINGENFKRGEVKKYGFGKERTLADFERYAGVRFRDMSIQQYTLDKHYPPNPILHEGYDESFINIFKYCITFNRDQLKGHKDFKFWAVAFEDKHGKEMVRCDVESAEIEMLYDKNDNTYKIWREFPSKEIPTKWIVWPETKSDGWLDRIEGVIDHE